MCHLTPMVLSDWLVPEPTPFLSDDVIVIAYCHRLCEVERSKRDVRMSGCKIGSGSISFPESAILLLCAKDLELWDNPCQNSGYSRSNWLLYFTGSSLRAVSFKTGNENVERLLANVLFTSETENGKEDR